MAIRFGYCLAADADDPAGTAQHAEQLGFDTVCLANEFGIGYFAVRALDEFAPILSALR